MPSRTLTRNPESDEAKALREEKAKLQAQLASERTKYREVRTAATPRATWANYPCSSRTESPAFG